MDVTTASAPPVVAVCVVHEPAADLDATLAGLRAQDYANLRYLFLVAGDPAGVEERIHAVIPGAPVRAVPGNPGFGAVANAALRLVEGSGFFCFLHDDVSLDPDAVSRLIEELYRSNAGIVGPKLVEWDDPRILQSVGHAVDRFGEIDPLIEPGEVDQEQHDAVRDVFEVPTACLMIRADLLRSLGGFDTTTPFHGDSLDLCWRAHLNGARVIVVPAARGRHRGHLLERLPEISHGRLEAAGRARTVATLTGRWRTLLVLAQFALVAVAEIVVGIFTGRAREGLASLYALVRLLPSLPSVLARRRAIRPLRLVPDGEVAAMQLRGSARLLRFIRHRTAGRSGTEVVSLRTEDIDRLPLVLGTTLTALFLFGSRGLIRHGVPGVGQFAQLPGPRSAWHLFLGAWRSAGFGGDAPTSPALAIVGAIGSVLFGRTGLLRTALILLPVLAGYLGVWRSLRFLPSARARIGGTIVYASVPLPYTAIATGRWAVLACYGALPWAFDLIRGASGLTVLRKAGWGDDEIADAVIPVRPRQLGRYVALLGLLGALVGAFAPAFLALVVALSVVLALGTLVAGGSRTVLTGVLAAVAGMAVAFVLLVPFSFDLLSSAGWAQVVGPPLAGARRLGWRAILTMQLDDTPLGLLALALYVPVLAGVLVARGWRLTWASRAGLAVVVFLGFALADDRDLLPIRLVEPGILMTPVALGLALAAACALAGFERDIRSARFGWRQPLGLLMTLGLAAGGFQALVHTAGGRWSAPKLGLASYLSQLPAAVPAGADGSPAVGDYRVLFLGDPRLLPVPSRRLTDGIAYGVADDGPIGLDDLFLNDDSPADALTKEALTAAASETTDRVGRLLAPLAVRYLVVPAAALGTPDGAALPGVPDGLVNALNRQLDLRRFDSPNALIIFENTSWLPRSSLLDPVAALSSAEAGADVLAARELGTGTPVLVGDDLASGATATVPAGTLHLAVSDDDHWNVSVDGVPLATRPAFGWSLAADVPAGGSLTVRHEQGARRLLVGLEGVLVLAAILAAVQPRVRLPFGSPREAGLLMPTDPVIDLSGESPEEASEAEAGEVRPWFADLGPTGRPQAPTAPGEPVPAGTAVADGDDDPSDLFRDVGAALRSLTPSADTADDEPLAEVPVAELDDVDDSWLYEDGEDR